MFNTLALLAHVTQNKRFDAGIKKIALKYSLLYHNNIVYYIFSGAK